MDKKYVYVLVSQTGTWTSKVIQKTTKSKYCHVSLSLDAGLEPMYSFGRRVSWTPFFGGFIKETPKSGIFQRYPKTEAVVLRFEITEEQYAGFEAKFEEMLRDKKKYKYDYYGAFMAKFRKSVHRKWKSHCAKFSKALLETLSVIERDSLPKAVIPQDFAEVFADKIIYEGNLQAYCKSVEESAKTEELPTAEAV